MTPDHEAAKKMAEAECRSPLFPGQASHNMAAAYLDAMARLDKATELLERYLHTLANVELDVVDADTRAFLAKHRKTGATDGK